MTLPVVRVSGAAFEQGVAHGRALAARVAHNVRVYLHRFEHEARLVPEEARARAARYLATLAEEHPAYHAGMAGIAEGAGVPLEDVALLNVRYELLYHAYGQNALLDAEAAVDGCTSFAVLPEASATGELLVGQNWDWIPEVAGAVVHTTEPDGRVVLAFTEAGIFGGKIGLSSDGVALAINGMTTTTDAWSRLTAPFHVRCYEILRRESFDGAVGVVTDEPRAVTANYLVAAAPNRAVDLEAAPETCYLVWPKDGLLAHANHFVNPDDAGVVEPPSDRRHLSCARQARLRTRLEAARPVSEDTLEEILRDHTGHPESVCRHKAPDREPAQRVRTVASVITNPAKGTMRISDGPPCESSYQRLSLDG